MNDDKIIKKEEVYLHKNLLQTIKGSLVLTQHELVFSIIKYVGLMKKTENKMVAIPLNDIVSINIKKGFGTGTDYMDVLYNEQGVEKKITFEHISFASLGMGQISRLERLYFTDWQKAIDDARLKNN